MNSQPADNAPPAKLLAVISANQLIVWATFYYAFSIHAVPMNAELKWSQPSLMGAFTVGLLGWAVAGVPVGIAIDRGYGRWVLGLGSLVGGLACLAWAGVQSIEMFYGIWFVLGFVMAANLYDPAFAIITRTYGSKFRHAITTVTLVGGFASTLAYPLLFWMNETWGWRNSLIVIGLWHVLVTTPSHWWATKVLESFAKSAPNATKHEAKDGMHLGRVLEMPVFWCLTATFTLQLFVVSAMWAHMLPLLLALGLTSIQSVSVVLWIGPTQVAGRALQFILMRHVRASTLGVVAFSLLPIGIGMLLISGTPLIAAYTFAICMGACNGIATIVRGTIIPEVIGSASIGAVTGALSAAVALMRAVAPFLAAVMLAEGGYPLMLKALLVVALLSVAAFVVVTRIQLGNRPPHNS